MAYPWVDFTKNVAKYLILKRFTKKNDGKGLCYKFVSMPPVLITKLLRSDRC